MVRSAMFGLLDVGVRFKFLGVLYCMFYQEMPRYLMREAFVPDVAAKRSEATQLFNARLSLSRR